MVARKLQDETSYITELAVCDAIIRPILDIIAENYHLKVWSHVSYHVDEEKGLASSLLGAQVCYGIVTTGAIWQFGKLEGGSFILDPRYLSATTELQRVFNTVNWVFYQIS